MHIKSYLKNGQNVVRVPILIFKKGILYFHKEIKLRVVIIWFLKLGTHFCCYLYYGISYSLFHKNYPVQ